uniref:Laminin N-terminal domain-containing protein n=1 Tax=Cyprinus carpio TaxID=7962 RepID=A0A8C1LJ26_CYPCA
MTILFLHVLNSLFHNKWDLNISPLVLPGLLSLRLQDKCVGNSCYPNLGELMASSTCGLYRPQNYCILGYLEVSCHKCNTSRGPNVSDVVSNMYVFRVLNQK